MQTDPNPEDFSPQDAFLNDALAQVDDLLPLWQRFGPEQAEERREAACRQLLELDPEGPIERLLAVNLVVVQAAALNCLQRAPDGFGDSDLRNGARLMDLCLRLAKALSREQKTRQPEAGAAREAGVACETGAQVPSAPLAETAAPLREARASASADPTADAPSGLTPLCWQGPPERVPPSGQEGQSDEPADRSGPPGHAPPRPA